MSETKSVAPLYDGYEPVKGRKGDDGKTGEIDLKGDKGDKGDSNEIRLTVTHTPGALCFAVYTLLDGTDITFQPEWIESIYYIRENTVSVDNNVQLGSVARRIKIKDINAPSNSFTMVKKTWNYQFTEEARFISLIRNMHGNAGRKYNIVVKYIPQKVA